MELVSEANLAILAAMTAYRYIFSKTLRRDDWLIIVANLIPVYGVWFLGWSAVEVFTVYAMETLIVGMLTVLKLLIATLARGKDSWHNQGSVSRVTGLFFVLFFILHFGIFAAVQTTIFSSVAGISRGSAGSMHFFFHWWEYINRDMAYMLGGFVIAYLVRDFFPFLFRQQYRTIPMMILMFQPYGRIFIQQITVILGSMFLIFGAGKIFILVFAAIKICFEVLVNYDGILNKTMEDLKNNRGQKDL